MMACYTSQCCFTFTVLAAALLIAFSPSETIAKKTMPDSTISAAPALLPDYPSLAPSSSSLPPALSPDLTPLFPTPGGPDLAPSDNSLPIIPSSPSPPNPDALEAEGPGMAFAPSGLLPDSSSVRLGVHKFLVSLCLVAFGLVLVFGA